MISFALYSLVGGSLGMVVSEQLSKASLALMQRQESTSSPNHQKPTWIKVVHFALVIFTTATFFLSFFFLGASLITLLMEGMKFALIGSFGIVAGPILMEIILLGLLITILFFRFSYPDKAVDLAKKFVNCFHISILATYMTTKYSLTATKA